MPGAPAILPQLQLVFEESADQLASAATSESQETPAALRAPLVAHAAADGTAPSANGSAVSPTAYHDQANTEHMDAGTGGRARSGDAAPELAGQNGQHVPTAQQVKPPPPRRSEAYQDEDEELDYGEDEDDMEEVEMERPPHGASGIAAASSGPAEPGTDVRPSIGLAVGPVTGPSSAKDPPDVADEDVVQKAAPPARTVGPAMPPPELLAAAQEAALAVRLLATLTDET